MSIHIDTYLANIKAKTGKTPADFKKLAEKKGFINKGSLRPDTKATDFFNWLKEDFGLGRGHAMAVYHRIKESLENKS